MNRRHTLLARCTLFAAMAMSASLQAQATDNNGTPAADELRRELAELRLQVAHLEAALEADHGEGAEASSAGSHAASKAKGMGGMGDMGDMGDMGGKRMQMMGRMREPASPAYPSSLPGFPGSSHLYHVGASGHFLDHAEHIGVTSEQRRALAEIHEQDLLEQADYGRAIEAAEQELWVLTSKDQPDAEAIEKQVRSIAELQVVQRLSFIRSVGRAAEVLTGEQRRRLSGDAEEQPASELSDSPGHQH